MTDLLLRAASPSSTRHGGIGAIICIAALGAPGCGDSSQGRPGYFGRANEAGGGTDSVEHNTGLSGTANAGVTGKSEGGRGGSASSDSGRAGGGTTGSAAGGTTLVGKSVGGTGFGGRTVGTLGGSSNGGTTGVAGSASLSGSGGTTIIEAGGAGGGGGHVAGTGTATRAGAAGAASECKEQLVAPLTNGGLAGDLVYDSRGELHVAYIQAIDAQPVYVYRVGGAWQYETIAGVLSATSIQLTVEASGVVHAVVHVKGTGVPGEWVYVRREISGDWAVTGRISAPNASLAYYQFYLDAGATPTVIFAAASGAGYELRRSSWKSGAWLTDTLATLTDSASEFSVSLDKTGRPWIATAKGRLLVPSSTGYQVQNPVGWTGTSLDFAVNESGTEVYLSEGGAMVVGLGSFWAKIGIPGAPLTDSPVLHVGSDGSIFAAISRAQQDLAVEILQYTGTDWVPAINANLGNAWGHAVARAVNKRPHAFSANGSVALFGDPGDNNALRVREQSPNGASTNELDVRQEHVASSRSMILDRDGHALLGYYSGNSAYLFQERADGTWDRSLPSIGAGVDITSLTLDPSGNPCVALVTADSIGYASLIERNWVFVSLSKVNPIATSAKRRLVVTFDESKDPHLLYAADGSSDSGLWHLTNDGKGPRKVYESALPDTGLGVTSDALGIPHVVFNGPTLNMARWSGTTWQIAEVATRVQPSPAAFVNGAGNSCVGEPGNLGVLYIDCDLAGQLVRTELSSDIGAYKQLVGNTNGTITIVSNSLVGAAGTQVYTIDPVSRVKTLRVLPQVEEPSILVMPDGGLRLAHYNSKQMRLFTISCGPE